MAQREATSKTGLRRNRGCCYLTDSRAFSPLGRGVFRADAQA